MADKDELKVTNPQGPNPTKSNPAKQTEPGAKPQASNIETVKGPNYPDNDAQDHIKTGYDPEVGA